MMKTTGRIRIGRLLIVIVAGLAIVIGALFATAIVIVKGVSDASFRYSEPTQTEIEEEPELARYLK